MTNNDHVVKSVDVSVSSYQQMNDSFFNLSLLESELDLDQRVFNVCLAKYVDYHAYFNSDQVRPCSANTCFHYSYAWFVGVGKKDIVYQIEMKNNFVSITERNYIMLCAYQCGTIENVLTIRSLLLNVYMFMHSIQWLETTTFLHLQQQLTIFNENDSRYDFQPFLWSVYETIESDKNCNLRKENLLKNHQTLRIFCMVFLMFLVACMHVQLH
jgi:hypothetical protein